MCARNRRDQRQAESAAGLAAGRVAARKALYQPHAIGGRDAGPAVAYAEARVHAILGKMGLHCDRRIGRRVLEGVVEQVGQCLRQQRRGATDPYAAFDGHPEWPAGILGFGSIELRHAAHGIGQIEALRGDHFAAGFEPRDGQQCVEGAHELVGIGAGLCQCRAIFARLARLGEQHFDTGFESRQRFAQIVRHVVGYVAHARHGGLDACEHVVEMFRQKVELVGASVEVHPLRKVARRNRPCGPVDRLDPRQPLPTERKAQNQREQPGQPQHGTGRNEHVIAQVFRGPRFLCRQ